jgi:hypothetical protein
MLVVSVPVEQVIPYARNPRKNGDAVAKVAASIREFGFRQPIVVDPEYVVIVGHTRLLAARQLGMAEVPVHVAEGLTAAQVKAYRLADNRVAQDAEWDEGLLTLELSDLAGDGFALELTGFEEDELAALLNPPTTVLPDADLDALPEVPAAPITKLGDLIKLGRHRLLCGDSTDADSYARVLDGDVPALCLTDPPYGIGEQYRTHDDTQSGLADLVSKFLPLAIGHSDRVLLTPGNGNQWLYPRPDWMLCWHIAAGVGLSGWGFVCWQPVLAYGKDPYLAAGLGARPDSLSQMESADNSLGHPCSKPVGVWTWFMERGSVSPLDVVLDPFGGSGTTLMAAEKTGRRARLIELDPAYCDVIVTRWENATGQKAIRPK